MMGGQKLRGGTERWTENNLLNSKRRPVHMLHLLWQSAMPSLRRYSVLQSNRIIRIKVWWGKETDCMETFNKVNTPVCFLKFPQSKTQNAQNKNGGLCDWYHIGRFEPSPNHQRFMSCKVVGFDKTQRKIFRPALSTRCIPLKPWHSKISQCHLIQAVFKSLQHF